MQRSHLVKAFQLSDDAGVGAAAARAQDTPHTYTHAAQHTRTAHNTLALPNAAASLWPERHLAAQPRDSCIQIPGSAERPP